MANNKIRKIEVLTEPQRRRRWSADEKKATVDETYQPAMSVSIIARRHDIAPTQLFVWRRTMENGALTGVGSEDHVVPQSELKKALDRIKRLEQSLVV